MEDEELQKLNVILDIRDVRGLGFLRENPFIVYCSLLGTNLESTPCRADAVLSAADLLFIWSKGRSSLERLRACNIKVEVQYPEPTRDRIGFLNISLREAQNFLEVKNTTKKVTYSWRPLLGARKGKPQLYLNIRIEKYKGSSVAGDFRPLSLADSAPAAPDTRAPYPVALRWDPLQGLFTMSPRAGPQRLLRFALCVKSALNLDLVLLHGPPMKGPDFQFSYEFLDCLVPVASFSNIVDSAEGEDRTGLYFRGTIPAFRQYFEIFPLIVLRLMIGEDQIGYANVNVNDMLNDASWGSDACIKIEKRCYIFSSRTGAIPSGADGSKPSIVAVLSLKFVPEEEWRNRNKSIKNANLKENIVLSPTHKTEDIATCVEARSGEDKTKQSSTNETDRVSQSWTDGEDCMLKEIKYDIYEEITPQSKQQMILCEGLNQYCSKTDQIDSKDEQSFEYFPPDTIPQTPLPHSHSLAIPKQSSLNSESIPKASCESVSSISKIPVIPEATSDFIGQYRLHVSVVNVLLYDEDFCGPLYVRFIHPRSDDSCVTRIVIPGPNIVHKCEDIQCVITYNSQASSVFSVISSWPPVIVISKTSAAFDLNPVRGIICLKYGRLEQTTNIGLKSVRSGQTIGKLSIRLQLEELGLKYYSSELKLLGNIISPESIKENRKRALIKRKRETLRKKKMKKEAEKRFRQKVLQLHQSYREKFEDFDKYDEKILAEILELRQQMNELKEIDEGLDKLLEDIEFERKRQNYKQCKTICERLEKEYKAYEDRYKQYCDEVDVYQALQNKNSEMRAYLFPTEDELNGVDQNLQIDKRLQILELEIKTCHQELRTAEEERFKLATEYEILVLDLEDFIREKKLANTENRAVNRYMYYSTSNYVKKTLISRGVYPGSEEYSQVNKVVQEVTSWESHANIL